MTPMENVYESGAETIRRYAVEGGWLYEWAIRGAFVNVTFVPFPSEGRDAPSHVCAHGYAARTCGLCERDGKFRLN